MQEPGRSTDVNTTKRCESMKVINNVPALVIALILVIPVSIIGMRIAEKVMKKQIGLLD